MTTTSPLTGVLPVLQYPVRADGGLDVPALRREIDFVFASGCAGVTLAMVSEITRLTLADRLALLNEVVAHVAGRGPVVCSVVAESSAQVMELAKGALDRGASALLAALPLASDAASPALALSEKHLLRKHGASATYGQKKS
jgi:dihydrodipicolinate synthase/N-acetylneuraminate lyase